MSLTPADERIDRLTALVEKLVDNNSRLTAIIAGMAFHAEHPVDRSIRLAELDDEPYPEWMQTEVNEARKGPFLSAEQVRKELDAEQ